MKFCLISEGKADIYIRNGKTMGWDIAAGIAILKNAGGSTLNFKFKEIKLNKKTFINESFFCFREKINFNSLKSIIDQYKK